MAAITIHFKKNNIMATNLDKSENTLTEVQSVSFVRGIDGSGNSVRISAANLASVLGAFGGVSQVVNVPPNSNMDSLTTLSFYNINNASQVETIGNLPVISTGRMIAFPIGGVCLQVYFTYGSNYNVYVRSFATAAKNAPWKVV